MRELNAEEQIQVTGGAGSPALNPAVGPLATGIIRDVYVGVAVQEQLGQLNVRDQINPGEITS